VVVVVVAAAILEVVVAQAVGGVINYTTHFIEPEYSGICA
jgi:hypothetical protein